jgi:predicted DsbA family dithiol-disulfide isomerase
VPHHRQPRGVDRGLILAERHHVRAGQAVQGEGLCGGIGGMLADGIGQVGRVRQGQRQAAAERRVGADRVADRVQAGGAVSPGGADPRVKRRQPRSIDQHLRWTGGRRPAPERMFCWRVLRCCLRWNHAIVLVVATVMNIEIWSDVVCPWCYIGKRQFERAVASFSHPDEITVTYRSFELDPDAPAERSGTHAEHLAGKYGMTITQAEQAGQQMTQRAAADGLEFRFDLIRGGNTFDAHRLLHLAKDHGLQPEMKERLMRATFTEGLPIADRPTLARLAAEVGLPAAQVQTVLDGDTYADAVRADEQQAARYGITGVPFFVADGKYAVSGAQPPEVLLQLLQRAYDETSQLTPVTATTGSNSEASCDGDSCAVS